ncbi:MAG: S-layer homology domain-containing protein [Clostridia bacterium]|nr:S-layer homology domain-containing protein [Clostridia bacterium]
MKRAVSLLLCLLIFISTASVCVHAYTQTGRYQVATSALNFREVPVNGAVVAQLPFGETVNVTEIKDGWAKTTVNGKTAWCSMRYLVYLDTDVKTTSQSGLDLIKNFEGFAKYAYWDYAQWTIGYGTRCEENEYPDGITTEQAEKLLRDAIVKYEMYVNSFLGYYEIEVTQNQFDALVSLTYNIGSGWTSESKLREQLLDGIEKYTDEEITEAFCQYVYAGGEMVNGLVTRRKSEANFFLAQEHVHVYISQTVISATCMEAGETKYVCACGDEYTVTVSVRNHKASDFIVTLEPTKDCEGLKIKRCVMCNMEMEEEVIPKIMPDINLSSWYFEGAKYCITEGFISGNDKGMFMPANELTREQLVVMLARFSGKEISEATDSAFADVELGSWYANEIEWAAQKGYVKGIGNGENFGVGKNITRQELCVILYRYAKKYGLYMGRQADLSQYKDQGAIADWAQTETAWAIEEGLLSSTDENLKVFSPEMTVTRAQAAKIFMSFDIYMYNSTRR